MKHSLLFTGHMVDAATRAIPRFPAAIEESVKQAVLHTVKKAMQPGLHGIASGACGGDILFHEAGAALGIPTAMYLPLPVAEFSKTSVAFAGDGWEARFKKLVKDIPYYILPATEGNREENIWERTNQWMLHTALENGGSNMTLVALWDGKAGDGSGGTEHMIQLAQQKGAAVTIIDINAIRTVAG